MAVTYCHNVKLSLPFTEIRTFSPARSEITQIQHPVSERGWKDSQAAWEGKLPSPIFAPNKCFSGVHCS